MKYLLRALLGHGVLPVALAAVLTACGNPAVDSRIELLGDEPNPNLDPAQYQFHRPGQPCVLCHGEYEGADPPMSIGGTVYERLASKRPAQNVLVELFDAAGTTPKTPVFTNCVGNFFVLKDDWDPQFPVHVGIRFKDAALDLRQEMGTRIGRDGSCAGCHLDLPDGATTSQNSPGRVYLLNADDPAQLPPIDVTCPVPFVESPAGGAQ